MPPVREEIPEDYEAIRNLNRLAFGGDLEAELVDRLRSAGVVVLSLVAVEKDEIVGHILFSALPIETNQGVIEAVSLAPMSVNPKPQRRGIGSALVRQGLRNVPGSWSVDCSGTRTSWLLSTVRLFGRTGEGS